MKNWGGGEEGDVLHMIFIARFVTPIHLKKEIHSTNSMKRQVFKDTFLHIKLQIFFQLLLPIEKYKGAILRFIDFLLKRIFDSPDIL